MKFAPRLRGRGATAAIIGALRYAAEMSVRLYAGAHETHWAFGGLAQLVRISVRVDLLLPDRHSIRSNRWRS
jgi:hypothetical protein